MEKKSSRNNRISGNIHRYVRYSNEAKIHAVNTIQIICVLIFFFFSSLFPTGFSLSLAICTTPLTIKTIQPQLEIIQSAGTAAIDYRLYQASWRKHTGPLQTHAYTKQTDFDPTKSKISPCGYGKYISTQYTYKI